MAFIDLEDEFPKVDGVYSVLVNSVDNEGYETKAKWTSEENFRLIDGELADDAFIVAWWITDTSNKS